MKAVKKAGGVLEATVCISGDLLVRSSDVSRFSPSLYLNSSAAFTESMIRIRTKNILWSIIWA